MRAQLRSPEKPSAYPALLLSWSPLANPLSPDVTSSLKPS